MDKTENKYKIKIETLGCRLNQIESEAIGNFFSEEDFSIEMIPVSSHTVEDELVRLCILNTCTVTQKAEQKARRVIRLLLNKYPCSTVLVTGCYAQLSPKEILDIDKRIAVIGGRTKSRITQIPKILKEILNKNSFDSVDFAKKINEEINSAPVAKQDFPEESFTLSTTSFINHSRASLKIQDGCNCSCSYCAIHMARGHSVSINVQTAIDRVLELESKGNDEVVLTTVNIGQYNGEYEGKYFNFSQLLAKLLESTSTINFRISSLYPQIVNEQFCEVIKDKRVRPHFHISVQSGSDKVLGLMNRNYKAQAVIDACEKIREVRPDAFIACDIITGFPGETEEDFNQTMDLCKKCNFAWIHAFPFSERPGTPACTMGGKVPQSVSGERAKQLTTFAINNKIEYLKQFVGKETEAILETVRRPVVLAKNKGKFVYHGVTPNFIHCEIVTEELRTPNKTVKIQVDSILEERILKGGDIEVSAKFI